MITIGDRSCPRRYAPPKIDSRRRYARGHFPAERGPFCRALRFQSADAAGVGFKGAIREGIKEGGDVQPCAAIGLGLKGAHPQRRRCRSRHSACRALGRWGYANGWF